MRALAPLAALSLAACGGLSADVEIERFCYAQTTVVPGTVIPVTFPPGSSLGAPIDLKLPLPPLLREKGASLVRLEDATITAIAPAGTDLAGIETLRLEERPAGGPAVVVASYTRPLGTTGVVTRIVASGQGVDILQATRSGTLQVQVTVAGTPPTADWTADIKVCAFGKSKIDYF